jgi:hypothetical protein
MMIYRAGLDNMAKEISLGAYKKAFREVVSEEAKRVFLVHIIVYVLVNAMLVAINLIYTPDNIWFFYPLMGWGIGISMNYLFSIRWIIRDIKGREAKAEYRIRENQQ